MISKQLPRSRAHGIIYCSRDPDGPLYFGFIEITNKITPVYLLLLVEDITITPITLPSSTAAISSTITVNSRGK